MSKMPSDRLSKSHELGDEALNSVVGGSVPIGRNTSSIPTSPPISSGTVEGSGDGGPTNAPPRVPQPVQFPFPK